MRPAQRIGQPISLAEMAVNPPGMDEITGRHWTELDTPVVLVELDRLERNVERMATLARTHGVALRPHVKTHKSIAIARMQVAAGAVGLTAAKLDEAEVFARAGFTDLFVAYELVTPAKLARAIALAGRVRLAFGIDSPEGIEMAAAAARDAGTRLRVRIEIDSGLHRCGVPADEAVALARLMAARPELELEGVFTHAGHAYAAESARELDRIGQEEADSVLRAAELIGSVEVVSVGNTPTAARSIAKAGVTEARPGNYVFYDGMQVALGAAGPEDCALTVAATVISRPAPDRAVLDAGAKTLGLDRGAHGSSSLPHYGSVVGTDGALARLSEEHGVLELPPSSALRIGETVRILPNHACAVANLAAGYAVIRGDRVVDWWPVDASGAVH
jgi:D-serine deaminase-like pyridoxal phosphate-dependent protein